MRTIIQCFWGVVMKLAITSREILAAAACFVVVLLMHTILFRSLPDSRNVWKALGLSIFMIFWMRLLRPKKA